MGISDFGSAAIFYYAHEKIYYYLCGFFTTLSAHATLQGGDPLVWKGETVYPVCEAAISDAFPKKQYPQFDIDNTANWKSYTAKWEIKGDRLYLVTIEGKIAGKKVVLEDLFPRKKSPIQAMWFSGTIIIPCGREIGLLKGVARHIYEKETHITVKKGKVVKVKKKVFHPKKTPVWETD